jgi:hypothetical protein
VVAASPRCDLCGLLCDLFLLPIASDFNRILPGVILKQQSATPTKALKFTLACPITIYFGQHWMRSPLIPRSADAKLAQWLDIRQATPAKSSTVVEQMISPDATPARNERLD